jgi:hypothetical protein
MRIGRTNQGSSSLDDRVIWSWFGDRFLDDTDFPDAFHNECTHRGGHFTSPFAIILPSSTRIT